jgi:hypothetical protein
MVWVNTGDGQQPTLHSVHLPANRQGQIAPGISVGLSASDPQTAPEPPATVSGESTGGTFQLSVGGEHSAPITHDAGIDEMREALERLSGDDNVVVTGGNDGEPWTVTFMGQTDVVQPAFLTPEQIDEMAEAFPPLTSHGAVDIDIDSSPLNRRELRNYIRERYGEHNLNPEMSRSHVCRDDIYYMHDLYIQMFVTHEPQYDTERVMVVTYKHNRPLNYEHFLSMSELEVVTWATDCRNELFEWAMDDVEGYDAADLVTGACFALVRSECCDLIYVRMWASLPLN